MSGRVALHFIIIIITWNCITKYFHRRPNNYKQIRGSVYYLPLFKLEFLPIFNWTEISSIEGQDLNISCAAPWKLQNFTLTWSFTKGHESSTVYTYDSLTQLSSSVWKDKVRLVTPRGQGGDGSLQFLIPLRLEHAGLYTCILSALRTKHEVRTRVNITPSNGENMFNINHLI